MLSSDENCEAVDKMAKALEVAASQTSVLIAADRGDRCGMVESVDRSIVDQCGFQLRGERACYDLR